MLQIAYRGAAMAPGFLARFTPALGRAMKSLVTYLGVDSAVEYFADLAVGTGSDRWTAEGIDKQIVQFVGRDVGKIIPIVESATRCLGQSNTLKMLESIKQDKLSDADKEVVDGYIELFEGLESRKDEIVGDGDEDTIWGKSPEEHELEKNVEMLAAAKVRLLRDTFGSIHTARAVRDALFGVEDEDFDTFEEKAMAYGC